MAKIIELIIADDTRGTGKEGNPVRRITQLWSKSGELIAEKDEFNGETLFFPNELAP